ncbi:hypothetical protein RAS14_04535 [Achromobacter aegrifaciens]|uniref:hypothetical protein n=1 Tax=Achromobacter aegrifaciens TaxID=1287736 RepID=UPI00278FD807|nr:hypothetical protein [Achromobacter aegrifaciens]MDQ1759005.1 hypothetical protein [Achromobacter aegrifaciens]
MDGGSVIGHQSLFDARMKGFQPADVWVSCVPEGMTYGSFTHPDAQIGRMTNGRWVGLPEIHIHDGENAALLDLRVVVGLVVHILAPNRRRALQLMRRVSECSPAKVIASGPWGLIIWQPAQDIQEYPA